MEKLEAKEPPARVELSVCRLTDKEVTRIAAALKVHD